jgi:hypothetical protein
LNIATGTSFMVMLEAASAILVFKRGRSAVTKTQSGG